MTRVPRVGPSRDPLAAACEFLAWSGGVASHSRLVATSMSVHQPGRRAPTPRRSARRTSSARRGAVRRTRASSPRDPSARTFRMGSCAGGPGERGDRGGSQLDPGEGKRLTLLDRREDSSCALLDKLEVRAHLGISWLNAALLSIRPRVLCQSEDLSEPHLGERRCARMELALRGHDAEGTRTQHRVHQ
jgi:hypothetical protein